MTGLDRDTILDGVDAGTRLFAGRDAAGRPHPVPDDYCIVNTSERVLGLFLGTAKLSNAWDDIHVNDMN